MKDDKTAQTALVIFTGGIVGLALRNTTIGKSAAERVEAWMRAKAVQIENGLKVLSVSLAVGLEKQARRDDLP